MLGSLAGNDDSISVALQQRINSIEDVMDSLRTNRANAARVRESEGSLQAEERGYYPPQTGASHRGGVGLWEGESPCGKRASGWLSVFLLLPLKFDLIML